MAHTPETLALCLQPEAAVRAPEEMGPCFLGKKPDQKFAVRPLDPEELSTACKPKCFPERTGQPPAVQEEAGRGQKGQCLFHLISEANEWPKSG